MTFNRKKYLALSKKIN